MIWGHKAMMKIIDKIKTKQADIYAAPPVTIAFLGDSVTQGCFECYPIGETGLGTVFDSEYSIARNLEKQLRLLYPTVQINFINSGINGDSAPNGLARFERDITPFSPDLVVVGYALNDSGGGEDGISAFSAALKGIFEKVKALGAECIYLTPNMMNTDVSVHHPNEMFRTLAAEFAERQNGGLLDHYAAAGKKCAEDCGVVVCDMYAKWKAMQAGGVNITELLSNKFNHPVRELNAMTAYTIAEALFTK